MLVSAFVEEMDFVGSGDSDGGVDGNVRDSYADDPLMIVLEVLDLSFREETHQSKIYLNFLNRWFKSFL